MSPEGLSRDSGFPGLFTDSKVICSVSKIICSVE